MEGILVVNTKYDATSARSSDETESYHEIDDGPLMPLTEILFSLICHASIPFDNIGSPRNYTECHGKT